MERTTKQCFTADITGQLDVVNHNVQYRLCEIGIEFAQRVAKLAHILRHALIGILDAIIQISNFIKHLNRQWVT
jgi:hypothetical protein